ncbi:MAG: aldo/keto reductase [Trichormus sp. ATA11-4-KO1]|jgi:aryl-alcohol dehydrogenase-like predicted oxidoreductase|nr:aldo/keto reductase [Trichormus sp. ATA11-4-KO1]
MKENIRMTIPGRVTAAGTRRYREKHQKYCASNFFYAAGELITSSIGIGTLINQMDEQTDQLMTQAIAESVRCGVNLIDTSISYGYQQAERSIGKAIYNLLESGEVSRDELIICTKGGVIPHPENNLADWFQHHYVEPSNCRINMTDIAASRYCIHPEYLQDQLNRSLKNLGLQTIDVYYIHNPERQLLEIAPDIFYSKLRAAFEVMEDAVDAGKIAAYGLATWEGFRVPPTSREHLDLAKIKSIAQEVAGNKQDRFRFIQFPLNMVMLEALLSPTQQIAGQKVPILEAAYRLGMIPVASNSIYQGQIAGKIPEHIATALSDKLWTDCQRALQYTRSTPGIATALVGMKGIKHIEENLALKTISSLEINNFQAVTHAIVQVLKSMQIDDTSWTFDLSKLSYSKNN